MLPSRQRASSCPPRARARGSYTYESGHAAALQLLEGDDRPTAVFCGNDVIALGALNACHRLGLRVPDDVSVVGFDDIGMAGWDVYRLTTVRQDLRRMAQIAVETVPRIGRRAGPGAGADRAAAGHGAAGDAGAAAPGLNASGFAST